ncbi:hypothetical protein [Luteococcus peritonei]|uniref:Uncharacterized protein n=1 Tax=Luteococcus peritonei TaxID=88874 RepID=A0ABW4RT28_9ACTN
MTRRTISRPDPGAAGPRRDPRGIVIPALLFLLGLGVLLVGLGRDCISLGGPGGPEPVCQTTVEPGAVIFTVICWMTALLVWLAGRRA